MTPSLTADQTQMAALQLADAEEHRKQCRQFSLQFPGMNILDAYRIQSAWVEQQIASGRKVKGHKIGLTSKAMRRAVGIDEPDYGVLLDSMFYADGARIPTEHFIELKIEAELAFVLGKPLSGPDCTLFDVLDATAYITPALELLDARIQRRDSETGRMRGVMDTISDNAANAAIILGGRPFKPDAFTADVRRIGAIVSKNGEVEETGLAAAVLNHPANGVAWLANRLHQHGVSLEAGQVILAGSFIRPVDVIKGDTVVADYGEFGTVACHFA